MEHSDAGGHRSSVAIALSSSLQTGNGYEPGSISQGPSHAKGGEDVAHIVSVSEASSEACGHHVEQSLRTRLSKDARRDADGLSQDALACEEGA